MQKETIAELLTTKEVAELVAAGERTVWRWSRSGVMPTPVQIGPKAIRYRKAEIQKWIDAGCPRVGTALAA